MLIKNQVFDNDKITLDGNSFDQCTFNSCEMIYGGVGPVSLSNSKLNNVTWHFVGNAANTMDFLKTITDSMGDSGIELLLNTFPRVRKYVLERKNAKKH